MKKILLTALVLAGFSATAQVKVGTNPTTLATDANLQVEATDGGQFFINKTNGNVSVGKINDPVGYYGNSNLFVSDDTPTETTGRKQLVGLEHLVKGLSGTNALSFRGLEYNMTVDNTNSANFTNGFIGIRPGFSFQGTGTIGAVRSLWVTNNFNQNVTDSYAASIGTTFSGGTTASYRNIYAFDYVTSGTITNYKGYEGILFNNGSGKFVDAKMISLGIAGLATKVDNLYGLYIDPTFDNAISIQKYSIYNDANANSYFKGNVGIGSLNPASKLDVNGYVKLGTADVTADATPSAGLVRYNATNGLEYHNGTAWNTAGATANEWTYNGTDAIQAKRALAGGNFVGITDTGRSYSSLGGFDWATRMNGNHTNTIYSLDPTKSYPNVQLGTFDGVATVSPYTTLSDTGTFTTNLKDYKVTQAHLGAVTNAVKNYYLNLEDLYADGTTTTMGNLIGRNLGVTTQTTSSSTISNMFADNIAANHFGTGYVGNLRGITVNAQLAGTGTAANIVGGNFAATSNAAATGNISGNLTGLSAAGTHSGTGTLPSLRGITSNAIINPTGAIPTNTYGIISQTTNNSDLANVGLVNIYGFQNGLANNKVGKFNVMNGFNTSMSNIAAAGAPTNFYGIQNSLTNSSSSTDAMSNITAYLSTATHNGASVVSNMTGLTQTVVASGVGSATTLRGAAITLNNTNTSANTTTQMIPLAISATHSAANNTVTNFIGVNAGYTISGKVANGFGIASTLSNSSALGNNITSWYGADIRSGFTAASTDNVSNMLGIQLLNDFSSQGNVLNQTGLYALNRNYSTVAGTMNYQSGAYINNIVQGAKSVTENHGAHIRTDINTAASGTITNNYGLRIQPTYSATSTALVTNHYGLYIDAMAASPNITNSYALYSNGGNAEFRNANVTIHQGTPGTIVAPVYTSLNFKGYALADQGYVRSGNQSGNINASILTFGARDNAGVVNENMRINGANGNLGVGTTDPKSKLHVVGLPVYADNAAAITAGLTAGAFYHAGDGIVRVVF